MLRTVIIVAYLYIIHTRTHIIIPTFKTFINNDLINNEIITINYYKRPRSLSLARIYKYFINTVNENPT